MIDHGFSSGGQINRAFALLMLVAVVMALGTAARFYFVSLLGEKVVADLRSQLYAHLIQLGAGFHDRSRSGELVSRLTADTELLRSVPGDAVRPQPEAGRMVAARHPAGGAADHHRRAQAAHRRAQQPGPHRRCQQPGQRDPRCGAYGAGPCP
ncbi:hypothetical protein G6F24_015720 [Rhizopus arrhizus]|nr:hypothetical protein G6F24_015720 [Rhizopus arrhizus]